MNTIILKKFQNTSDVMLGIMIRIFQLKIYGSYKQKLCIFQ